MLHSISSLNAVWKNVAGKVIRRTLSTEKIGSSFAKTIIEQYKPRNNSKLNESIYGGLHLVTLVTDSSEESQKCAGYVEKIISSTQAPITLEHVVLTSKEEQASLAIMSIKRNRSAIKITVGHDKESMRLQYDIAKSLGIYASVTNINSYPGFNCRFPELNITLVIKNVQNEFSHVEYEPKKGVVQTLRHIEDDKTFRFITFAFNQAILEERKKITFVHNVERLPLTDGRFLDIVKSVSVNFPEIEVDLRPLDYVVRKLIWDPTEFDTICSSGRYGNTLTAISSAVAGSPNLYCCMTRGDNHAVFTPLHTKLSLSEFEFANAYGILRCCCDLMRHLGLDKFAFNVCCQTCYAMMDADIRTPEFCGEHTDSQVIDYVTKQLYANNGCPKDLELSTKSKF